MQECMQYQSGKITNMPPITLFQCPCTMCNRYKMKRPPRCTNPINLSNDLPWSILYCDLSFYNVVSISRFISVFDTICGSTRCPFTCCARQKCPPIHCVSFLINILLKHNHKACAIKYYEGGELARSTEFYKFLIKNNIILSTSGGYNISSNGRGERSHQDFQKCTRVMLATNQHLPPTCWYYARLHARFCVRRLWHSATNSIQYYEFLGIKPSYKDIAPWGFPGVRHNNNQEGGFDMRGHPSIFLGYRNATNITLSLDKKTRRICISYHFRVDRQCASTPTYALPIGIKNQLALMPYKELPYIAFDVI